MILIMFAIFVVAKESFLINLILKLTLKSIVVNTISGIIFFILPTFKKKSIPKKKIWLGLKVTYMIVGKKIRFLGFQLQSYIFYFNFK
jgi:hypothetical protein